MFGGSRRGDGLPVCSPGISAQKENVLAEKKKRKSRRTTSHEYSGNDNSDYMYYSDSTIADRKEAVMK